VTTEILPLVTGIPGPTLEAEERTILERVRPAGIILFSRNVVSATQVRELVDQLEELPSNPFLCIDLEGGAVNRLSGLWGELPSPAEAAAVGRRAVRALGEAAGAACRSLGIHLDLAPVVDLETPEGLLAREGRCLSDDPERAAALAGVFTAGLASWCVSGCLKHYPGLGPIPLDTHLELPVLEGDEASLEPHLAPFETLSASVPTVMMAHVVVPALGDAERPASLVPRLVRRAAELPGRPVVLSDDLEMGALGPWGDLEDRAVAALAAGNHGIIVSKAFDRLPAIAGRLVTAMETDTHLWQAIQEASARLGTLRNDLCRTAASMPAPDDDLVATLWEQARREATP